MLQSKPVKKFVAIALLSLGLTFLIPGISQAQLSLFGGSDGTNTGDNRGMSRSFWNVNRSYLCGELKCADVWLYGTKVLMVATYPEVEANAGATVELTAEQRARRVQGLLERIVRAWILYTEETSQSSEQLTEENNSAEASNPLDSVTKVTENLKSEINKRVLFSHGLPPISPDKLELKIGKLNDQEVIAFPAQHGLQQQVIVTVTELDAIANNMLSAEELAPIWKEQIRTALIDSLGEFIERAENTRSWYEDQLIKSLKIAIFIVAFTVLTWLLQRRLRKLDRSLKKELQTLEKSMAVNPESVGSGRHNKADSEGGKGGGKDSQTNPSKNGFNSEDHGFKNPALQALAFSLISKSFLSQIPTLSLKQQSLLKQRRNLIRLLRRILMWGEIFIVFFGISHILDLYPETRNYSEIIETQYVFILLVWLFVSLADRVSDFLTDYYLNRWAKEQQLYDPTSQRYALRANTSSRAIKGMTTILFGVLGILWTIQVLGISTAFLASAGVVGLAITYFSQNTIKDVLNGILILFNDRYAVGDVIAMNEYAGAVESMNLYITELRNLDGELITIPNGLVGVVRNMTKNWSRVNFTISIGYAADIEKAIEVMKNVAKEMQEESEWEDLFLEPLSILGVEEVAHTGVVIRGLIKTKPSQQWAVGREFRYRVKQAFERDGIAIGIPQQNLWLQPAKNIDNFTKSEEN
ncbi:MAG: mechanosensitive ion channel family protein [Limnospira sp.]